MPPSIPVPPHLRSSESTAFNADKYGHIINWTKTSVLLRGKPVTIVSAEFHYFRVPDRERWRSILLDIKGMGFNAVRLYIHWGYHSPAEGVYNFSGNRDIDYLLTLCEELHLFAIAAPGPYICAEVQAGGFPMWLVAKRNVRIRHLTLPPLGMIKRWDDRFHKHCADYMRKIIPLLVKHELTTNPNGCIIALQVENELREPPFIGVGGLDNEIRLLCEIARECGSTVPLFHNDDSPIGSWAKGEEYRSLRKGGRKTGVKAYRTDLYGFDMYFTFPPGDRSGDLSSLQIGMVEALGVSACLNCCGIGGAGVGGSDTKCLSCLYESGSRHSPPPPLAWASAKQMESAVDKLGQKLDSFGGSARDAPAFVAEAQVGWINQWGRFRTYDDVYNFFGDQFSATLQLSLMSQGVTFTNHYIAYGGTNHGTIGDSEVYTSYDYSAFIREFGLLSARGRVVRQAALFSRSFADYGLSDTIMCPGSRPGKAKATCRIKATVPKVLVAVRETVGGDLQGRLVPEGCPPPTYAFLRNLKDDKLRFNLIVDNMVLPCNLIKCESMVAPLYHSLPGSSISIFACTVPVLCRTNFEGSELWFLRVRKGEVGRVVLKAATREVNGEEGVLVKWATMASNEQSSNDASGGEVKATSQDPGAATSLLSAPLEELPLESQNSLGSGKDPFSVRTSTEEVGLCFSFSFNIGEPIVIVVNDLTQPETSQPIIRLVCLNEECSSMFTASLTGNDVFRPDTSDGRFAAAWGASNLAFEPSGTLSVGFSRQDEKKCLFVLRENSEKRAPEQFESSAPAVAMLLPGLFLHQVPDSSLSTALKQGVNSGDPLSRRYEVPVSDWSQRVVDWDEDVMWKRISYRDIDPLDHLMTSGHIAYRVRFRSASQRGYISLNVRHTAVVWCNRRAVGSQVCFSHNILSAGAMHGLDLSHSGKKKHDLSEAMRQIGQHMDGFHEVIILVLSLGQSRSPFLLNDVRNKRGLLSARLSRSAKVSNVSWDIAGVDVTLTDDAYASSGLPLEDDINTPAYDVGFTRAPSLNITANNGLVYYRGSFKVPSSSVLNGSTRYPLRVKMISGAHVRVMLWINNVFIGRYVEDLGPQYSFYVPEGLIKECKGNLIVLATYGSVDTNFSIQVLPWIVDQRTGNLDEENGHVYALRMANFNLDAVKGKPLP